MRVGLLAPPFQRVPPVRYGGTERVIATLADALVARGHDVTLFASADSETTARLVSVVERPVWSDARYTDERLFLPLAVGRAYAAAGELDIMHNHLEEWAFPAARLSSTPTVTTLHWRLDRPELQPLYAEFREQRLVSVSHAQRAPLPRARWLETVHHGYPATLYRPSFTPGSYLVFCGRFSTEKGLADAIQVALAAGRPLRIAARRPPADSPHPAVQRERSYYETVLAPYLGHPLIEYVGEVGEHEKQELYAGALALVFPIDWPEPFGLVMIEALACGTPVLARPRGSVPEVVAHGVTGFHCETQAEFVDAVARVHTLDRQAARAAFEARFSAERMAAAYETVYGKVVEQAARRPATVIPLASRRPALVAPVREPAAAGYSGSVANRAVPPSVLPDSAVTASAEQGPTGKARDGSPVAPIAGPPRPDASAATGTESASPRTAGSLPSRSRSPSSA